MLPYEFWVPGPPISHQSHNRHRLAAWRRSVRGAALANWPPNEPPENQPIEITVAYYHDGARVDLDGDNLVKPIQDALIGSLYADDGLIVDTHIHRKPLDGSFKV